MVRQRRLYIAVMISGTAPLSELLGESLFELGAEGLEERMAGDPAQLVHDLTLGVEDFGDVPPELPAGEHELLCGFREAEWDRIEPIISNLIQAFQAVIPDLRWEWERQPQLDSVARWRKDLRAYVLTDRTGIAPTRSLVPHNDSREWFIIPPKMSFGTGEHATTRIASKLTGEWTLVDDNVLDAGCGTGVLGLVALAHGAKHVTGVEVDPDGAREARNNIVRNGYQGRMTVHCKSIFDIHLPPHSFDLILANIHLTILKPWWARIPELLKPGGRVIATGLLSGQARKLPRVLGRAVVRRKLDSWVLLGFRPDEKA